VLQLVGELLLQGGWEAFAEPFRARKRAHSVIAAFGLIVVGGLLGLLTSFLLPTRLFGSYGIRGASIVISPIITGLLMERYGVWCDEHGRARSHFATFWGGALFALSMAAVRSQLVGSQG
jgi:hypothetical protein